jgi:hypothetical protein
MHEKDLIIANCPKVYKQNGSQGWVQGLHSSLDFLILPHAGQLTSWMGTGGSSMKHTTDTWREGLNQGASWGSFNYSLIEQAWCQVLEAQGTQTEQEDIVPHLQESYCPTGGRQMVITITKQKKKPDTIETKYWRSTKPREINSIWTTRAASWKRWHVSWRLLGRKEPGL